jgi:hypothetical protein
MFAGPATADDIPGPIRIGTRDYFVMLRRSQEGQRPLTRLLGGDAVI